MNYSVFFYQTMARDELKTENILKILPGANISNYQRLLPANDFKYLLI